MKSAPRPRARAGKGPAACLGLPPPGATLKTAKVRRLPGCFRVVLQATPRRRTTTSNPAPDRSSAGSCDGTSAQRAAAPARHRALRRCPPSRPMASGARPSKAEPEGARQGLVAPRECSLSAPNRAAHVRSRPRVANQKHLPAGPIPPHSTPTFRARSRLGPSVGIPLPPECRSAACCWLSPLGHADPNRATNRAPRPSGSCPPRSLIRPSRCPGLSWVCAAVRCGSSLLFAR